MHPELRQSFAAYITADGRRSRIDMTQADRIYSAAAMDQVENIRRRTNEFLDDVKGPRVTARLTGENAESADIRALIRSDQVQSWYIVPAGVFLVLILTLRDPLACLNLVATMVADLCFRPGGNAPSFRHASGGRGHRLESAVFPVRRAGCGGRGLQRVPDGPAARGIARSWNCDCGSPARSARPAG